MSLETSNVVNVPQKEAVLGYLSRSDYLWEVNFDFIFGDPRPQMWEMFHKLRMDYDTCSAVAAPLRLI
ncbi:hypothetical protein Taro_022964, partial [Colocasia esculenta]|nr:hypothetical protein [Colocasia esculenta]